MSKFNLIIRPADGQDTSNPAIPERARPLLEGTDVAILVFMDHVLVAVCDDYGTARLVPGSGMDGPENQDPIERLVEMFGSIYEGK